MVSPAKVLLIPDAYGWAWHYMAKGIAAYATEPYHVEVAFPLDVAPLGTNHMLGRLFGTVMQFSLAEGDFPLNWSLRDGSLVDHAGWFWTYDDSPYIAQRLTSKLRNRKMLLKKASRCDVLLVKNQTHLRKLRKLAIEAVYVPPAVDTAVFTFQEPRDDDKLVVGWCGQVPEEGEHNQKGYYEVLLPLVDRFRKRNSNVRFLVNRRGAGDAFDQHTMARWYAHCDVFLCTSMDEGGPMPVLEAMACGRPVISTKCGFVPDVVRDGETGWLLDQWWSQVDAHFLVQQLDTLISELACDLNLVRDAGEEAARDVRENWSWRQHANTWLAAMTGVSDDG